MSVITEYYILKGVLYQMIDTIKMVTMIPFNVFTCLLNSSTVKTAIDNETGEIFYKIINDTIEGSYSSNIIIRIRWR